MATNTAPTVPATRAVTPRVINTVGCTVNFDDAGIAAGVKLPASIPAGAIITRTIVVIKTAFNAATTNPLQVGTTPTGSDVVSSTDSVAATIGAKHPTTATALGVLAADTVLYANYIPTGAAPTTGKAHILFEYAFPA